MEETIYPREMKSYITTSTKLNINGVPRGSGGAKEISDLSGWASWGKFLRACKFGALN